METVRFHIHRKGAFAGCTLTYRLNINGAFVGALKNGGTLDIIAARAKCYYIDKAWSFDERNGYFEDDGSDEYNIVIKHAGGWRTGSCKEFFRIKSGKIINLPSFHYDRYLSAIFSRDEFSELSEAEKIFTRCLEFGNAICDDMDALLCSEHYHEMLKAVKRIGAQKIYDAITSFVSEQFAHEIELPFEDSPDSYFYRSAVSSGNAMIKNCRKNGAYEEFHKCMVHYLIDSILTVG